MMVMFGITTQICHFLIIKNFPFVTFLSFNFIGTMILEVVNHYLAFSYFSATYYPFFEVTFFIFNLMNKLIYFILQVITYFTLCLWLVPFALFVSVSTNDNILPTILDRKGNIILFFNITNKNIFFSR